MGSVRKQIDAMGRIQVPKDLRNELKWFEGDTLELTNINGSLNITKLLDIDSKDYRRTTNYIFDKNRIDELKKKYPVVTKVRCINMKEDISPVTYKTEGTIEFVDDLGSIHVKWKNGSSLALIEGEDDFEIIK